MSTPVAMKLQIGSTRTALGVAAILVLLGIGTHLAFGYVTSPSIPRPHDFLQVWSAGRLNASGLNPYDGERMYALQVANRMPDCRSPQRPNGYASMMWVPPWGLAIAMPLGAIPIDIAQLCLGLGTIGSNSNCGPGSLGDRGWRIGTPLGSDLARSRFRTSMVADGRRPERRAAYRRNGRFPGGQPCRSAHDFWCLPRSRCT